MAGKTLKMLLVALVAAFTMSSMAEAATPKKTRHRAKHSSRVASGAAPARSRTAAKKKSGGAAVAHARVKAPASTTKQPAAKKAPLPRRPTTKPH